MRWTELVDDLAGLAASWERRDRELEVADRTRGERGRIELVNRLRGQLGAELHLTVPGAGAVTGELLRVGRDWLLLGAGREVVVPVAAISMAANLDPGAVHPEGVDVVSSRLPLTSVLRGIAGDRSHVTVVLRDGGTCKRSPAMPRNTLVNGSRLETTSTPSG